MIYRILVNAAFLAVGYYIGKEVGRLSREGGDTSETQTAAEPPDETHRDPSEEDGN